MKKKTVNLKRLALTKNTIAALQQQDAVKGGASARCLDDGTLQPQPYSVGCPADSDLCYSGNRYISQCCV